MAKRRKRKLTRSEHMGRVRQKNTSLELRLRKALWARGLRYRLQLKLPGRPDFGFPGKKVCVFVDGCFWHGCPEHYTAPKKNAEFWRKKVEDNMARDRRVDEELRGMGWTPVRVWGHEVKKDLNHTVERLCSLVVS